MLESAPHQANDGSEQKQRKSRRMPPPPLREPRARVVPSPQANGTDGLKVLLDIEAEARRADSLGDLYLLIANETRKLTRARQIFVFHRTNKLRMAAISGIPRIDRNAPLIQDIEGFLVNENVVSFSDRSKSLSFTSYTFPFLLWLPMTTRDGKILGGFLLAREFAWDEADRTIAERVAETYAHALAALMQNSKRPFLKHRLKGKNKKLILAGSIAALLLMAIPMPMFVLAPMEVLAQDPFIVAAPIQGVIEDVLVNPGDVVAKDQPLVRMGGTELRNKLEVAQRQVRVSEARLRKANQMAFAGNDGHNELRMAMADLNLKMAESAFAQDMFDRTVIRAEQAGVVVLSNKQALSGKPVVTGERIMQIADPKNVEIIIHLPVKDSIVLQPDAHVKVFLDSDPISSRDAKVAFGDYQALPVNGDQLVFRVVAKLLNPKEKPPRLGVRGTARIYGQQTFLGIYLFRRPLAAARQWIGL